MESRQGASVQGFLVEAALFVAVLAVALVAFVYVPVGVAAAVSQDGLTESMHTGLGSSAPLPVRLFRSAEHLASGFWPLVAAAGLAHVALRWVRRRGSLFGESLLRDVFSAPLVTVVATSLVAAAVLLARGAPHALDRIVWPGVGLALGAFLALGVAGLLLALGRRHRAFRRAMAIVLISLVVVRVGAEAWGRIALSSYEAAQAPSLAALDARRAARTRPVLRGDGLDEDAWPRYEALLAGLRSFLQEGHANRVLASSGDADPFAKIPPDALAVLEARRGDVAGLRVATRCRRCVPAVLTNPVGPVPSLLALRHLANLTILEERERAQAGDLAGAADRCLDVVRFGGDVGGGNLIHALLGSAVEQVGLRALARLCHSGRLDAALLERIERERALLEASRASLAEGLANESRTRLGLGKAVDTWEAATGEPLVLPWIVPYRALAAHALRVSEPLRQDFLATLRRDDFEGWKALAARSDASAGDSWNPLLRIAMGYTGLRGGGTHSERLFLNTRRSLAFFRLLEAVVKIEKDKRARGRYPDDAAALRLPKDPFAPELLLRYRQDGQSYRVWSVGTNGVDDGGKREQEADIVL